MNAVTQILSQIEEGHPQAAEALLPMVYEELRRLAAAKLAREKPGQTLQTTALVHEAYLRLVDANEAQSWNSRGHFFAAAAEAMRRILINAARDKKRLKRGWDRRRLDLDQVDVAAAADDEQLIDLDEALEALAATDAQAAELVKLMFFGGLVTGDPGYPAAVLIRGTTDVSGPGRITARLLIDKSLNGKPAKKSSGLWFEDRSLVIADEHIEATPRIGVDYSGEWSQGSIPVHFAWVNGALSFGRLKKEIHHRVIVAGRAYHVSIKFGLILPQM